MVRGKDGKSVILNCLKISCVIERPNDFNFLGSPCSVRLRRNTDPWPSANLHCAVDPVICRMYRYR